MKILKFSPLLALLHIGCASYGPVQMGSGVASNAQVMSCTHYVFTFPTSDGTRVDQTLLRNGLAQSDIYSIESRQWPYLFPIYSQRCTVARLNTVGAGKVTAPAKMAAPALIRDDEEIRPGESQKAKLTMSKQEVTSIDPDEQMAWEFYNLGDSTKCRTAYTGLITSRCIQFYERLSSKSSK